MRAINEPVKTYSNTLGAGLLVQPSQVFPNFGPIIGLTVDLTVTLAGATASKKSNSIDNVISHFSLDDQFGKSIADLFGTDLSVINDILQPRGVRTAPDGITTSGAGAGTGTWRVFIPITVGSHDMPATIKLTWNAASALQNTDLVSAGTVTCTLVVRAHYAVESDQPTLRIKASNPPHQQGDNAFGPYLPAGFQMQALAFCVQSPTAADADLGYLTYMQGGASFASLMPSTDFSDYDTMLMQSGHLNGQYICRFPVHLVDTTTVMTVNLVNDKAVRLYSIATIPQKRD